MNSPILLTSGVLSPGQYQALEPATSRMQNPFRTPMLIDEIRFQTAQDVLPNQNGLVGGQMTAKVEIWYGRTQLTRGFVPVGCFGKVHQTTTTSPGTFHTWRLPKPLYLPPEELLTVKLKYDPMGIPGMPATKSMQAIFAGRSLPKGLPPPKKITLPWVTHFEVPFLAVTNGNSDSNTSSPAELLNPFDQPLAISHFMGRSTIYGTFVPATAGGDPFIGSLFTINQEASGTWAAQVVWTGTSVRASDSFGNILVRDPTPFGHLFQYLDRTWPVNSMLAPKGYYLLQVDRNYSVTVPSGGYTANIAHAISMVGSREVDL